MSKVVDQRVVEMQFDNRHFERNVATSMSTLDKLKQKLNIGGAAKSLESIDTAARKVNLNGLGGAVESVSAKFSALQVMGVTALANITNSAVNAGKRIVSALTIDPIKTGFQEYETQINAVQTILANTSHAGTTLEDVSAALNELNEYADRTIYNFTEMTRNIGTFTAAGLGLEESTLAIKGIANLAAVSGSTSQQASTAMYQLSQALANGKVNLQDWNSVVNAGMGGKVFQDALIRTAATMEGVTEEAFRANNILGSFRESIGSKDGTGWLTSEVLSKTLQQFTGDLTDAQLAAMGYTEQQIKDIQAMAVTANDAATKVKTFTQLWDVMKESAQSGWAQTWKLIIGDFEEAKSFLTPISDTFTGVINAMSEARNKVLESALGRGFTHILDGFNLAKKGIDTVLEPINTASKALEDLGVIADKVIYGSFGNGVDRMNALSEAGYNFYRVQNKVNETLGNSFRYSEEQIEAQDKVLGSQTKSIEKTEKQTEATIELTEANKERLKSLIAMSDAQLKSEGYTQKQIDALRELERQAEKIGLPIDEFIDKLDEINGRWLLLNSFKNIGKGIVDVFNAMKTAWEGIFPPKTIEERGQALFDLIAGFHKLTSSLTGVIYENGKLTETGDKLVRSLEGVFAAVDIITTVVNGGFKIAFELIQEVLSYFNLDILDVTATIGDALVGFRDFVDGLLDIEGAVGKIAPYLEQAAEAIRQWIDGLKATDNIPKYIIDGLVKGLTEGVSKVVEGVVSLAKGLYDSFCEFFGINSPSTLMIAAGGFIVAGLITGLTQGFGTVADAGTQLATGLFNAVKDVFLNLFKYLKDIDFGTILSVAGLAGILFIFNKIADAISAFGKIFDGIGDIFEGLGGVLEGFEKNLKASALEKKGKALLNLALAIGILVAALFVLTQMCSGESLGTLLGAVGILAAIAGILVGLSVAIDKLTSVGGFKVAAVGATLLGLGLTMLLLAATAKIMGGIEPEAFEKGVAAVIAFGTVLMLLVATTQKVPTGGVKGLGSSIMAVGLAMLMMAGVAKIIAGMSWYEMRKAGVGLAAFTVIIASLVAITKLAGNGDGLKGISSVIKSVGIAMLLMVAVAKIIAGMTWEEMGKAAIGLVALGGIITGLVAATRLAGGDKDLKGVSSVINAVGIAMLLLAAVAKIIAGMTWEEMGKAAVGLVALGGIITGLVAATRLAGTGELKRVGTTLLLMSVSIGILGLIAALLGMMSIENLAKGVVAVGLLGAITSLMIAATKGAQDCKGNIIAMSVAIGIMAIAVAALSFIDPEKLRAPTIAMGLLMGMFSTMLAASKLATGSIGTLITLTVVVGLLAGVVALISGLPIKSTIANSVALSALILAFSGALVLLSGVGATAGSALLGVLSLTAMAVPLLAFVGILALMENLQNAMSNVAALTLFAGALTLMLIPLTLIGSLAAPALLGVLSLTAMAVPLLAFVGILALMENLQNAEQNLNGLIKLTTAMTAILTVLAIIGPMATVGVGALASLTALMIGLGTLATGIGALTEKFPALQTFLDSGIALLEDIAYGLGSVVGHFVTGFSEEVMSLLPKLGTSLSDFMANATPFIEGASSIDSNMLDGVRALAETILILTAVDVIEGLTSWLTGGSSLASFGEQLPQLGRDLSTFANSLGTFDEAKVATITCATNAIKAIADAANNLPNEGGWLAKLVGDNTLSSFGSQLPELGTRLSEFATNLGTFGEDKVATITCAGNAVKAISEAAESLPNEGGWLAKIVGDNGISTFGSNLPQLGIHLAEFATNLGTFGEDKVATITCAGRAIKAIADVASDLPNEGGWLAKIVGDNGISTFGSYLPGLGSDLAEFANNLGTFGDDKVDTVNSAVKAVKAIAGLADADLKNAKKHIGEFGDNLGEFASDIASFCSNLSGLTNTTSAITNLNNILDAIDDIADADTDAIAKFGDSLKTIGEDGVNKFIKAFTSSTAKTDVKQAAITLMEKAIEGFKSEKTALTAAAADLMTHAAAQIKGKYQDFYDAGAHLVTGIVNGISANSYKASAQAAAMATAAAQAAKDALGINSPSRVFYEIGEFTGLGFVNALSDYSNNAYSASFGIGESARRGLSDTIGKIKTILDGDLDIKPTIRPVLDLSNVRSGVGTISDMLKMDSSTGVLANVGVIGSMMNRRSQNGDNAEVVSAIDKLRKGLDKVGNTTYSINGVTYDDGSNISDAVKTIVRAAKIERRV